MSKVYTIGSLFSGIGGLEIGLERTGRFKTLWNSDNDEYCQGILKKIWPDCPVYGDVKSVRVENEIQKVDVICGGFPCQDLSLARNNRGPGDLGKGLEGPKSGLYREFMRIIEEFKPKGFIMENVPVLVNRGLGIILNEASQLGYDVEWHVVSAKSVGGPHLRKRVFIMGYANSSHPQGKRESIGVQQEQSDTDGPSYRRPDKTWPTEPGVCRVVDGVPNWSHRVRALGNAVVPKVSELVGYRMLDLLDKSCL